MCYSKKLYKIKKKRQKDNELIKWADFLHAHSNLGKPNVILIIIEVAMVNNGGDFLDHWILKSCISHKWFDDLSRLTEWLLHANRDGVNFSLSASLLCIFDI